MSKAVLYDGPYKDMAIDDTGDRNTLFIPEFNDEYRKDHMYRRSNATRKGVPVFFHIGTQLNDRATHKVKLYGGPQDGEIRIIDLTTTPLPLPKYLSPQIMSATAFEYIRTGRYDWDGCEIIQFTKQTEIQPEGEEDVTTTQLPSK